MNSVKACANAQNIKIQTLFDINHNHLSSAAIRVHTNIVAAVAKCACNVTAPLIIPPVTGAENVLLGSSCGAEYKRDAHMSITFLCTIYPT